MWIQLQRRGLGRLHRVVRIAVETGVMMMIFLHEALDKRIAARAVTNRDIEEASIEGAVQRLRLKLMTVAVVMLSLGADFMGDIDSRNGFNSVVLHLKDGTAYSVRL
jgi:hypothetical protein